jgi:hypothetical protein
MRSRLGATGAAGICETSGAASDARRERNRKEHAGIFRFTA